MAANLLAISWKYRCGKCLIDIGTEGLVHTDEVLIEHFAPQADGNWLVSYHKGMDAVVQLASIGCSIALKDVYRGLFDEVAGSPTTSD